MTYPAAKFENATPNGLGGRYVYSKIQYLTLTLGSKVTCNVAQYPLHRMTYAAVTFEVGTSNSLGEDAFTRKYII